MAAERQRVARIIDGKDRDRQAGNGRALTRNDRGGTPAGGIGRIGGAIGLAAGKREEDHTRSYLTGIGGKPGNLQIAGSCSLDWQDTG